MGIKILKRQAEGLVKKTKRTMNTREEYVTCDQAKALKELGFDWPCRFAATSEDAPKGLYWTYPDDATNSCLYNRSFTIPTQAVACRWLREETGLILHVFYNDANKGYGWYILNKANGSREGIWSYISHSYEAALSAGIDCALELLKGGEQ